MSEGQWRGPDRAQEVLRATPDQVTSLSHHVARAISDLDGPTQVSVDKILLRDLLVEIVDGRNDDRSARKSLKDLALTLHAAGVLEEGELLETGYRRLVDRFTTAAAERYAAQSALAVARRELRAALRSRDLYAQATSAIRAAMNLLDRARHGKGG